MGTRHMTIVNVNGKTVIRQYGQWDGYPTGQGKTVLRFLQNQHEVFRLAEKGAEGRIMFLTDEQADMIDKANARMEEGLNRKDVEILYSLFFERSLLSRDLGADVLHHVSHGSETYLRDDAEDDDYNDGHGAWVEGRNILDLNFIRDDDDDKVTGTWTCQFHGKERKWDILDLPTEKDLEEFEKEVRGE